METVVGVFGARDTAEEAVKKLAAQRGGTSASLTVGPLEYVTP